MPELYLCAFQTRSFARLALSAALEREHRQIDDGIKSFINQPGRDTVQPTVLVAVLDMLRRHIYLEEALLFPPVRETGLALQIFVLMREHGQLWRTMHALMGLLTEEQDRGLLVDTCLQPLHQLDRHNAKEEQVFYRHADVDLPEQTSAELIRFIQAGRTPDGWVCRHSVSVDLPG